MVDIANVAQCEHWTTVAGPKWTGLGEVMDTRMREVNDLLLKEAQAEPGERILDVGCGTGTTTLPLAEMVGERGQVLDVDISEPMLSVARRRVAERGASNVSLLLADAQVHRFEPERFDLIASRFGVMFFENPSAAFRNLHDALRRGGRLCFVCWAPLDGNPHWKLPLDIVVRHVGAPAPKPPTRRGRSRSAMPAMSAPSWMRPASRAWTSLLSP
jgi:SAM-dependent methyltransferase